MDIQKITDDVEVQGEEYKEQSVVEEDVEDADAPAQKGQRQRGSSGRSRTERKSDSGGNQKTIILIAAAVLGVVIIIVFAMVYMKMQKSKVADDDDYGDVNEYMVDENSPLYQAMLDAEQNNSSGNQNGDSGEQANTISYSQDEIDQLRAAGYTGQEIEKFASQNLRVTTKIAEAKAEQRKFYEDNLADYLDGKSEKYKELETYTWLGQQELIYDANNIDNWNNKETVINCDYVKVPARGYQTFLRIEVSDGNYAFMLIRPERYQELPQTGNIVVYIKYYTTGDTTIIYQIEERNIQ